jgi:hypothetical protein
MSNEINQNHNINDVQQHILEAITQIKYGKVAILIHNSQVVEIETSKKIRFDSKKQVAS